MNELQKRKMEGKRCEFCGAPRPVVYCQADAAFLCLSCDAKVHSANALSGRHSRSLLCDSCRENPAFVRCLDHSMLLCQGCEPRFHETFSPHKKLMLKSFTGCPSAKHFAALWGLNVGEQNNDQAGSESMVSEISSFVSAEAEAGLSRQHKTVRNDQEGQNNSLVMQQILDLKKLQLTEGDSSSGELDFSTNDLQNCENNPSQGLKDLSQLEHLSSSSPGDSFWQSKRPADSSSQFWSQNLQDLGVCEDLGSFDDFNMPDVDATFRNFEDMFGCDLDVTRPLLGDDDLLWSDIEKETSFEQSGDSLKVTTEDVSAASSISTSKDMNFQKESHILSDHTAHRLSRSMEHSPYLIRSSCSASFSRSRLSAESSGSDFLDSGQSGHFLAPDGRESPTRTSTDQRKKARSQVKQSQLAPRKAKFDTHKRIKGRVASVEGYESDSVNATKSY